LFALVEIFEEIGGRCVEDRRLCQVDLLPTFGDIETPEPDWQKQNNHS